MPSTVASGRDQPGAAWTLHRSRTSSTTGPDPRHSPPWPAGFRRALGLFHEGGDLLSEATIALNWGLLAGGRDPEAAAAEKAAGAFFTERGADRMIAAYRAAFVPVADGHTAAPAPSPARTEVGSPAGRS